MLLAETYLRGIRMPRVAAGLAIAIGIVGLMAYYPGPGAIPRGIGGDCPPRRSLPERC